MSLSPHQSRHPSDWVKRWTHLIPSNGRVLDVACGHGRHMQWLSQQGFHCVGVDRDQTALDSAQAYGEVLQADLEHADWPFPDQTFDAIVVTHYLWRALWPALRKGLAQHGVLIYETFAQGHETVGKPSNPDFLLAPGELLQWCQGWHVVAYEDGFSNHPERFVQRIAAVHTPGTQRAAGQRFLLNP